jgi:gamma-glutamylcyclotransferase (GGCT)/AIG2-like uncharacterized protein YtfP
MLGTMGDVLYFAYGSNLDFDQMKGRCPSAQSVGVAKLPGRRLAFTRWSEGRKGAVADAVADPAGEVWGVVYEITAEDLEVLDRCEGFTPGGSSNAYLRQQCTVWLNGDPQRAVAAEVYFAVPQENPGLPSQDYRDQILRGAREWGLPQDYIEQDLETIETQ